MRVIKHKSCNVMINTYNFLFFKLITLSSNCLLTAPYDDFEPYLKEAMQSQVGKHLSTRGKFNCQYYTCLWNKRFQIKFFTINMYMLYWNIQAKDQKREKTERRHARPLEILNAIPLLGTIIQMPAVRIRKNVALTRATVIPIQSAMARLYVNWTAVLPTKGSESVQAAASSLVAHM